MENAMGAENRGRWVTVVANLGVLAGLLLLVAELRQNRDLMRAQIRHELSTVLVEHQTAIAQDPQLVSAIRRGDAGEELSPDEAYQVLLRNNALIRYWENVHYQYREGLYDEAEFLSHRDAWARYMANSPPAVSFWCSWRDAHSPEFRAELDGVLPTTAAC
jgi:hypothetical protein